MRLARLATACLLLALVGTALAQETFIGRMFSAAQWTANLETHLRTYSSFMFGIARRLAQLGLVGSLVWLALRGTAAPMLDILLRVGIVAGLLAAAPTITDATFRMWDSTQRAAMDSLQQPLNDALPEIRQLARDGGVLMAAVSLPAYGVAKMAGSASAVFRANKAVASSAGNWLNLSVIPVMLLVVTAHIVTLLTGVALAIANLIFPVAIAMLMFSAANGERWLSNYIGIVVSSLLTAAIMPLLFGVAVNFAVVHPVRAVNQHFGTFRSALQSAHQELPPRAQEIDRTLEGNDKTIGELRVLLMDADPEERYSNLSVWRANRINELYQQNDPLLRERAQIVDAWYEAAARHAAAFLEALGNAGRNWMIRLALATIGAVFAAGMMWHGARSLAGAVGGVALVGVQMLASPVKALQGGTAAFAGAAGSRLDRGLSNAGKQLKDSTRQLPPPPPPSGGPSQGGGRLPTATAGRREGRA